MKIHSKNIFLERTGWLSLCLLGLVGLMSTALFYIILLVLSFLTLLNIRTFFSRLSEKWPLVLMGISILYIFLQTLWLSARIPGASDSQWQAFPSVILLSGIFSLMVGFWLRGDAHRIRTLLSLSLIGGVASVLSSVEWAHYSSYMAGTRLISSPSPNAIGFISSIIFWGAAISVQRGSTFRSPSMVGMFVLLDGLMLLIILISQSRAVWLGNMAVLVLFVWWGMQDARESKDSLKLFILIALILISVLGIVAEPIISTRLAETNVTDSSLSQRIDIWNVGVNALLQSPIIGWGVGSVHYLMQSVSYPAARSFPHFHDLYLHMAVTLGLVGLALVSASYWCLYRKMIHLFAQREVPHDLYRLAISAALLFLIVGLFQVRHDDVMGKYLIILISSIPASYYFRRDD